MEEEEEQEEVEEEDDPKVASRPKRTELNGMRRRKRRRRLFRACQEGKSKKTQRFSSTRLLLEKWSVLISNSLFGAMPGGQKHENSKVYFKNFKNFKNFKILGPEF